MKLETAGTNISEVSVTDISPFGIWLYYRGNEFFLDYDEFPWFRDSSVNAVFQVYEESEGHLRWDKLDVDLSIDSIVNPQLYPNIYHRNPNTTLIPTPNATLKTKICSIPTILEKK